MGRGMRKIFTLVFIMFAMVACDKRDPILPGTRTAIFSASNLEIKNGTITDVPVSAVVLDNSACKYTQDSSNTVWDGARKIFSGFPTNNSVAGRARPVCSGKYVYAGLTTGEVVKINPSNRQIVWIADVYRASNLTGGASMVDIVVPILPVGNAVFAGGMGDAFCKINATSGAKQWCVDIGVGVPFVVAGDYAFVVSTDNYLYAISTSDGSIVWRTSVKKQAAPTYDSGVVSVGRQSINVADGKIIK